MTDLFEKSIHTLELPRVLELLADQAVTEEGKQRCLALRPMTDAGDVRRAQAETTAAVTMMTVRGTPSFSGVKPVRASLQRADMGGSLNTRELLEIAAVLRAARSAKDYGEGGEGAKSCIDHLFRSLTANRFLEEKITGSIHFTPGSCYDDAYNGNRSAVHWDMVLIQTPEWGGGQIYFDDVLIRDNGRFVIPELEALNPENLK